MNSSPFTAPSFAPPPWQPLQEGWGCKSEKGGGQSRPVRLENIKVRTVVFPVTITECGRQRKETLMMVGVGCGLVDGRME